MAKKKRPKYNLKSRITSALRRIWFYGPSRREAVKLAKAGGNRCSICKVPQDKLQMDHVQPVVPLSGEYTWDIYIDRLFNGELRGICKPCHKAHTQIQSTTRRNLKKILK